MSVQKLSLATAATIFFVACPQIAEAKTLNFSGVPNGNTWTGEIEFDDSSWISPDPNDPDFKLYDITNFAIGGIIPTVGFWDWNASAGIIAESISGNETNYSLEFSIPFADAPPQADPFFDGSQPLLMNFIVAGNGTGNGGMSWSSPGGDGWMLSFPLDGPDPGVPYKFPLSVEVAKAVPEPAATLSLIGLGLLGMGMRKNGVKKS